MEGRVPDVSDDPPTFDESPTSPPRPLPPPPGRLPPPPKETYIVQIPRDQIYRVPPPENAKIVERHQKQPTKPKKEKKARGKCFLWIFIAIVILAVIIGVAVGVILPLANPKPPEFSIDKFHVIFSSDPSPKKHAGVKYEITMKETNSNENMGISYQDGGKSSLLLSSKEIAAGKYPSSSQESYESNEVVVTLTGPKQSLPSIYDKESTKKMKPTHVDLSLMLKVPVNIKGPFSSKKDLKVTCSLRVSKSATAFGTKIESQECKSRF